MENWERGRCSPYKRGGRVSHQSVQNTWNGDRIARGWTREPINNRPSWRNDWQPWRNDRQPWRNDQQHLRNDRYWNNTGQAHRNLRKDGQTWSNNCQGGGQDARRVFLKDGQSSNSEKRIKREGGIRSGLDEVIFYSLNFF